MSFEVKIPLFEGPFDLLLFFIERDELDIYDIPISQITENFLEYLKDLEKLNIEVASEFILVAAKLMRIKAKMLLPRPQLDEEGNEIDPREELVLHLLEYKKYKSVLAELASMESEMFQKEKRGNVQKELKKLSETVNFELLPNCPAILFPVLLPSVHSIDSFSLGSHFPSGNNLGFDW